MYPGDLKLNKTNDHNMKTEYLDMDISTDGNFISSKVFDKRRAFPFEVIGFPFINISNIPAQPTYGIYISQLLRIVRICNIVSDFYVEAIRLTNEFIKKGFLKNRLHNLFNKFVNNYPKEWGKYGVPLNMYDYFKWFSYLIFYRSYSVCSISELGNLMFRYFTNLKLFP